MMEQLRLHTRRILWVIVLALLAVAVYFSFGKILDNESEILLEKPSCIDQGLEVSYPVEISQTNLSEERPLVPIQVSVKDKKSLVYSFEVENVPPNQDASEKRNCALYVLRYWDVDYASFKTGADARFEIWKYPYVETTAPELLIRTAWREGGVETFNYHSEFSISFDESYIALIHSYLGHDSYALHINNIETKENAVIAEMNKILVKYPDYIGDIELKGWTEDSQYFWFSIFDQADILAFVRVKVPDGTWELFPAPVGMMGGDAVNIETGWVTYDDGPPWTGILEYDQEYQNEWQDSGKKVTFSVYNLFTKESIALDATSDTRWWYAPRWINVYTLEYVLPGGEKMVRDLR